MVGRLLLLLPVLMAGLCVSGGDLQAAKFPRIRNVDGEIREALEELRAKDLDESEATGTTSIPKELIRAARQQCARAQAEQEEEPLGNTEVDENAERNAERECVVRNLTRVLAYRRPGQNDDGSLWFWVLAGGLLAVVVAGSVVRKRRASRHDEVR
jgi:hypothetical protein